MVVASSMKPTSSKNLSLAHPVEVGSHANTCMPGNHGRMAFKPLRSSVGNWETP